MTTTTDEAEFWDNVAEKYAKKPVDDIAAFQQKKRITRELTRPGAMVLEIGCGTGSLALELAPTAGHIHAMDISGEMIRIANAKKAAQGVGNVTFHVGTLESDLPVERVDSVWAYSILHLVDDRPATLRVIFELLEPGGVLISSNVCLGESWIPYGALIKVMHWFGKAPVVHIYDRKTIVRELEAAGFVEIEEKDVGADFRVAFIVAKKRA